MDAAPRTITCKGPCGLVKPETAFRVAKITKSGRMSTCRECTKAKKNAPDGHKYCSNCRQPKALSEFNKDPRCKFGVHSMCRICYNARHDDIERLPSKEDKACTTCGETKLLTEFPRSKHFSTGTYPRCKVCKAEDDKLYREEHIEQKRAKDREYYRAHAEVIKAKVVEWTEKNPGGKMRKFLNRRISSCIQKEKSTEKYTDCSRSLLMAWFEFQFDDKMNWDNMGTYWSIDHVRPCSSFNFKNLDDIATCFNWRNLRPLEARENISKGNRFTQELLDNHQNIVDNFLASDGVPSQAGNTLVAEI